jgi:hypothetical protein
MVWPLLTQFVLRLCFGLAAAMAITSPRDVKSGFFRVHLWVLMGLATFATLVSGSRPAQFAGGNWLIAAAAATAVLAYAGSVVWLYEHAAAGRVILAVLVGTSLAGAMLAAPPARGRSSPWHASWLWADTITSGMLLGATFAAMLLGHWYLNTPGMRLEPLRRLLQWMAAALVARSLVSVGVAVLPGPVGTAELSDLGAALLAIRWLAGILGAGVTAVMAWQTLKIPNTQSATGILYVGLVFVFLGELAALLLSLQLT